MSRLAPSRPTDGMMVEHQGREWTSMGWRDRLDGKQPTKDDDARFEALVDRHGAAIHRLARAIVGPDEAADVTQDVLVLA